MIQSQNIKYFTDVQQERSVTDSQDTWSRSTDNTLPNSNQIDRTVIIRPIRNGVSPGDLVLETVPDVRR